MLTAKAVSLGRGDQPILSAVSLSVGPRTRLGVVGPNGIGKSTLLRVLAGMETPDAGSVERSPVTLRVGYLAQEPDGVAGETLLGYLARRSGVAAAGAELDRRTDLLAGDPEQIDAYGAALDHFLALGGDDFEARAATACADLGLGTDRLAVALEDLSGGQAARAGLAAIMVSRFDVFLLDEPTNDLDFEGLDRLEGFLAALPGAVVVVSHDRAFLDRSVHRILELAEHLHTATEYAGAWSEYVERRATARSQQQAAFGVWDEQRRRLAERVRTQRSWSESGVRKAVKRPRDHDRAQRGFFINRTEKQASKVRTSQRALERLPTVDKPWEGWDLHLDLAPTDRSGDVVARLDGAVVERGTFRLGPVDVEIGWAERVVITGPNGGGKSTLLGALTGSVGLAGGARWAGPGVRFGELDQRRSRLVGATLLEGFTARTGTRPEEARSTLAKFGLGADQVLRRIDRLSPGERTRALLAALSVEGTNCLVLDEPTNHLDLPAIEQLESALEDFAGTLLLVTHDRWLLETVRVDRSVEVDAGRVLVGF
ncbi:MAG: ABC-F family ATP-binding cassette domain-containing protein [Acidimicrobiales bacterium]